MVDLIIIGVIKIPQLKQLKGACKKKGISRRNDKHSKGKFFSIIRVILILLLLLWFVGHMMKIALQSKRTETSINLTQKIP